MQVYKSISQIIGELSKIGISKDNVNKMQGYKFRGIDDIYNALAPLFSKYGVIVFPRVISHSQTERTSKKGDAIFYTIVECEFDFVSADDGSKHVVKTFGEAMDSADKSTNKAMSAAYKYACFQAFCIPTEGDNDADATTHIIEPKFNRVDEFIKRIPTPEVTIEEIYNNYKVSSDDEKRKIWGALDQIERQELREFAEKEKANETV